MYMLDEFAQLVESSSSREDFLSSLPSRLSPYEWRQMTSILTRRTFKTDLVASLPLELVVLIFKHLPPLSCFRYLRVSKTWRSVLSHSAFQNACLLPWFSPSDPPLAGESLVAPDKVGALRAEQQLAFKLDRPYATKLHVQPSNRLGILRDRPDKSCLRQCDFCSHRFAWIEQAPEGEHYIRVYDLLASKISDYRGKGRERTLALALTLELVAWVTTSSGVCYARGLSDGTLTESTRLPSANVTALAARGQYVALLLGKLCSSSPTVCLWDTKTSTAKSFQVPPITEPASPLASENSLPEILDIIIGQDGQTLALIDTLTTPGKEMVEFRKYSLAGRLLSSGELTVTISPMAEGESLSVRAIVPMNNGDRYVCLFRNPYGSCLDVLESTCPQRTTAMFDYKSDRLVPLRLPDDEARFMWFIWRGLSIRSSHLMDGVDYCLEHKDFTSAEASHRINHGRQESPPPIIPRTFGNDRILLDIKSVAGVRGSGGFAAFYVRSYDKHVELAEMPGESRFGKEWKCDFRSRQRSVLKARPRPDFRPIPSVDMPRLEIETVL